MELAALDPVAVGAFLSGAAAVISAGASLRLMHRWEQENCERRIRELREALREGFDMGHEE